MKNYIDITRLQVHAHHGVLEQERRVGNMFEVSVRLQCDFSDAAATDDVDMAVNYAEVVDVVIDVMSTPRNLLETVAFEIRKAICSRWECVDGGRVTVDKVHPPISVPLERVGITIEW